MATLALPHASLSGISRLQLPIPLRGLGPRTACRRCALETVEKVVARPVGTLTVGTLSCFLSDALVRLWLMVDTVASPDA